MKNVFNTLEKMYLIFLFNN